MATQATDQRSLESAIMDMLRAAEVYIQICQAAC